jgi:uncharacterized membrane protein
MTNALGETPVWALSAAYGLHMLATVIWIGGLAALILFVLPTAHGNLDAQAYANLVEKAQRRLDPLAWLSLAVLVGTGLFQMSASPNYQGFLTINNRWSAAILLKHVVFLGMVGVSAYLTWGIMPAMKRLAFLKAKGQETPEAERLQRQQIYLLRINLVLGMIVLGLTAVARASS